LRQANRLRILFELIIMPGQVHSVIVWQLACNNFNCLFLPQKSHHGVADALCFPSLLLEYLQLALPLLDAENAQFPATTIDADNGTLSPRALFSGDATMDHTPTQLLIDCLIKRGTAAGSPVEILRTAASAPALLCKRLLHSNILLQLKTEEPQIEPRDAVFLLPMMMMTLCIRYKAQLAAADRTSVTPHILLA
jgi:hypothetical protein